MRKWILPVLFLALLFFTSLPEACANPGLILHGLGKTLFSIVEIPRAMIQHSGQIMFPFGLATGAVAGSFRMVTGTVGGALEMAQGAAPYAKYMVFFL